MNQASAVRLQREVRQREDELRLCYDNMEAGQPPLAQIHDEWLRTERDTAARAAQRLQAKMVGLLGRDWGRGREGRRGLGRYTTSG